MLGTAAWAFRERQRLPAGLEASCLNIGQRVLVHWGRPIRPTGSAGEGAGRHPEVGFPGTSENPVVHAAALAGLHGPGELLLHPGPGLPSLIVHDRWIGDDP